MLQFSKELQWFMKKPVPENLWFEPINAVLNYSLGTVGTSLGGSQSQGSPVLPSFCRMDEVMGCGGGEDGIPLYWLVMKQNAATLLPFSMLMSTRRREGEVFLNGANCFLLWNALWKVLPLPTLLWLWVRTAAKAYKGLPPQMCVSSGLQGLIWCSICGEWRWTLMRLEWMQWIGTPCSALTLSHCFAPAFSAQIIDSQQSSTLSECLHKTTTHWT